MDNKEKSNGKLLAGLAMLPLAGMVGYKFGDKLIAKGINYRTWAREAADKEVFAKDVLNGEAFVNKWEMLKTSAEHKKRTMLNTGLPILGMGALAGTGALIAKGESETGAAVDHARGVHPYTGRIPVDKQSATTILNGVGKKNILHTTHVDELGDFLRSQKKRPVFGDDSELMLFGMKKKVPYVYNIGSTGSGKSYIKGKDFGIVDDATTGGLEINMSPGHSDQLHQHVHSAITQGTENVHAMKKNEFVLINNTLANLTGFDYSKPLSDRHISVGASSHVHFSVPAAKMKATTHRVVGATAALNYLIPGADQRAQGYIGHGTYDAGYEYAKTVPYAYVWEGKRDKGLAKKHGFKLDPERSKDQPWYPKKGHLATEVRFNAPMHGDPVVSKKYHQLIELALGDTEHAAKLETLGRNIEKWTGGEHHKLYTPSVRKQVATSFAEIIGGAFKNDTAIHGMINMIHEGKQLPIQNVVSAWKNIR